MTTTNTPTSGAADGFSLLLPQRPKPEAPAGTAGLDWGTYSGAQMLAFGRDCSDAAIAALRTEQPAPSGATEEVKLRKALVYAAFALHDTPQYMLAQGIVLIDGDTVRVSRDGWTVEASVNPHRQPVPATQQEGEHPALVCDYCGALTPDPWHSSGMLHGKMSKHIHSCDACAARGPADSVQEDALDAAFEAVRKRLCGVQRYSFVLDDDGLVRRVKDRTGNWIDFDEAHALFDPVAVDAACKQGGA